MNALLQVIAENMARDSLRWMDIQKQLQDASENGPWMLLPDEVADLWGEMTRLDGELRRRVSAINVSYDPSVARAILDEVYSIVYDGVT